MSEDATTTPAEPQPVAPRRPTKEERRAKAWAETKVDLKWATALLFVLLLVVSGGLWNSPWNEPLAGGEDLTRVADAFFSTGDHAPGTEGQTRPGETIPREPGLVVPFELLSVLLLAALLAGVGIALRDDDEEVR